MDNRQFNINGKTKEQLELALKSLLLDEYNNVKSVKGWYISKSGGFVLTSYISSSIDSNVFTNRLGKPCDIGSTELVDILWDWLHSDESKDIKLEDWDKKIRDSDIECDLGWRLYTDEWGHVRGDSLTIDHSSIAAFKPCWLWYGK